MTLYIYRHTRHACTCVCVHAFTFNNHEGFKRCQLWKEDLLRKSRWCPWKTGGFTKKYTLERHTKKEVERLPRPRQGIKRKLHS